MDSKGEILLRRKLKSRIRKCPGLQGSTPWRPVVAVHPSSPTEANTWQTGWPGGGGGGGNNYINDFNEGHIESRRNSKSLGVLGKPLGTLYRSGSSKSFAISSDDCRLIGNEEIELEAFLPSQTSRSISAHNISDLYGCRNVLVMHSIRSSYTFSCTFMIWTNGKLLAFLVCLPEKITLYYLDLLVIFIKHILFIVKVTNDHQTIQNKLYFGN